MSKKYIYANIRLPIEIFEQGQQYEILNKHMLIDFEMCDELPEPTSYEHQELIAKIFSIHKSEDPLPEEIMKVVREDYNSKTPKKRQNISFKHKRKRMKQTRKNLSESYEPGERSEQTV